ncbi:MAG: hypothetical protein E7313_06545 [Clostridiales bacterium]|nr:hypothetical protein [Clostridiales bacterium]
MHRIIIKNKKYLKFILIIFIIGILSGVLYYNFLNNDIENNIIDTIKNINILNSNYIIKDLVIMSVLLVSSFFIIGIPLSIFFLFYESLSIGFLINIFYGAYKIKGLIYIFSYLIINRLLNLILIIFFLQKVFNISKLIIGIFINKNDKSIKDKLIINFRNALYIILFVLIINIISYFTSPYILNSISLLLK